MQSKKPLTDAELEAFEAGLDMEALLVRSAREMAAAKTTVVHSSALAARQKIGVTQGQFADLLGVSVRTLQGWEQGRREPTGAAKALLSIALAAPEAFEAAKLTATARVKGPSGAARTRATRSRAAEKTALATMREAVDAAQAALDAVSKAVAQSEAFAKDAVVVPATGRRATRHVGVHRRA